MVDIRDFDAWIGRQSQDQDTLALPLVRRLAAALNREAADFALGDELPRGWHGLLFSPLAKSADLDVDGHPKRGDFLPPIPLPRRLFAGRRMTFARPLAIGDDVTRRSEVTAIREVDGASGHLVFVTARHTLAGPDWQPAVIEEQDVVYRENVSKAASREQPPHDACEWTAELTFDTVGLFRYSAAVFNAHRIHFDDEYARGVEGYDGLVVNASFATLHMLRLAELEWGDAIDRVAVRNRALVMAGAPVRVQGCVIDGARMVQVVQGGRLRADMQIGA